MKRFIALTLALIAQGAMAQGGKALPALPASCEDQINSNGLYCSASKVLSDSKTVNVTFAAVVSKDSKHFKTVDALLSRYTDFKSWPLYAAGSPQAALEFSAHGSVALPSIVDASGVKTLRHVYEYNLKIQGIPLLKQPVHGITYNQIVAPYAGAQASLEFAAQTAPVADFPFSPKGVKSQTGSIHVLNCDPAVLTACDASKWLVVYETTAVPSVSFAMAIAAKSMTAGIEDLLVGMLDDSIDVPSDTTTP
ncbi:MAG: hypothetical protein H7249_06965 [Chitinophagaceae bacterium]|nr:hypothetical protein [Oligoflexus sp.]